MALLERGNTTAVQAPLRKGERRPADALQRDRLGMVAWLAKAKLLQVRVCVSRFGEGIGQAKFGVSSPTVPTPCGATGHRDPLLVRQKFRPVRVAALHGREAVAAVRNGPLHEVESAEIRQRGQTALTDGLAAIALILARWTEGGRSERRFARA